MVENVFITIVLGIVVFSIYTIISFTINIYLTRLKGINLPIPYKFIDKKTPLYRIQQQSIGEYYSIQKWDLEYGDVNETYLIFVIGSGLFRSYAYRFAGDFGAFSQKDLANIKDLEATYEEMAAHRAFIDDKPIKELDRLNQDYNDNYID